MSRSIKRIHPHTLKCTRTLITEGEYFNHWLLFLEELKRGKHSQSSVCHPCWGWWKESLQSGPLRKWSKNQLHRRNRRNAKREIEQGIDEYNF